MCDNDHKHEPDVHKSQEEPSPSQTPSVTEEELTEFFRFSSIPADLCPPRYKISKETEKIIRGIDLREGMVVLWEHPTERTYPAKKSLEEMTDPEWIVATRTARWCKVTELRTINDTVTFTGVYADGQPHARTCQGYASWLVKIDSIPPQSEPESDSQS